jgi:very-short-patch-repair endonuclease/predicted transcriptional regulator of viral defense system
MAEVRPDSVALALAARQHRVVTTAQLAQSGLSKDAIADRVRRGWLRRRHRGVYVVGPLETPLTAAMAAVAACGEGALLSHHPAAVLWGMRRPPAGDMHVTVSGRAVHARNGIQIHRANLHPRDITRKHGIPLTSPARTLLDLAVTLAQRELDRAVEEAEVQRRVSLHSLNEQFSRYPSHRGTAALKSAIRIDPAFTRREAERRMLELIRASRLPQPAVNAKLGDWEVDFLWSRHRLVVETDGYAFHSSRRAFERDRRKDQELQAAGYRVIRFTWRQITDEPEALIATLATALAAERTYQR